MLEIDTISLASIYGKRKNDRDIFQELMPSNVKGMLKIFREAIGAPVEMEYALDLERNGYNGLPTLYILQIKPLIHRTI